MNVKIQHAKEPNQKGGKYVFFKRQRSKCRAAEGA